MRVNRFVSSTWLFATAIAASTALVFVPRARCEDELPGGIWLAEPASESQLPPPVQQVQQSLGGSIVEQFPSLRSDQAVAVPWWQRFQTSPAAAPPAAQSAPNTSWPNWSPPAGILPALAQIGDARPQVDVVRALRTTAAELDAAANRLEEFELYQHSDALRGLAQQLRGDARRMAGSSRPAGPSFGRVEGSDPSPGVPRPMRRPRGQRPRDPAPDPSADLPVGQGGTTDAPTPSDTPSTAPSSDEGPFEIRPRRPQGD